MAKTQTRRSISLRGSTYDLLYVYCQNNKRPVAAVAEEALLTFLGLAAEGEKMYERVQEALEDLANKGLVLKQEEPVEEPEMKSRRYAIRNILADPAQRRELCIRFIVSTQAQEGIETTPEQAARAYDRVQHEKLHKKRAK